MPTVPAGLFEAVTAEPLLAVASAAALPAVEVAMLAGGGRASAAVPPRRIIEGPRFGEAPPLVKVAGLPAVTVYGVRVGTQGDVTRMVFDIDREPPFRVFGLQEPYRIVIDLPEANWRLGSPRAAGDLVRELRYGLFQPGNSRMVIETARPAEVLRAFTMPPPSAGFGWRLVVDLQPTSHSRFVAQLGRTLATSMDRTSSDAQVRTGAAPSPPMGVSEPATAPSRTATTVTSSSATLSRAGQGSVPQPPPGSGLLPIPPSAPPTAAAPVGTGSATPGSGGAQLASLPPLDDRGRDAQGRNAGAAVVPPPSRADGKIVVMIDPGHGGRDPGAVGTGGSREKDITLAVGLMLRDELRRSGRYRALMTRDDDVFIRLRDRVEMARDAGAQLFISIHADSIGKSGTRGMSVYTLSEKASDQEAAALAEAENKADLIGGVDLSGESPEVTNILLDLAQRETMNLSVLMAGEVVSSARSQDVVLLPDAKRFAGFAVLKAPDVPSILVELGYLTNRKDEALLASVEHRQRLARMLARAVDAYFRKHGAVANR